MVGTGVALLAWHRDPHGSHALTWVLVSRSRQ